MSDSTTPFALVGAAAPVERAPKPELLRRVRRLEQASADGAAPAAAFACLQDARFLDGQTLSFYASAAARGADVALFARGLHSWVADGVRGVDLDDDDPLGDQWTVVLTGPAPVCFAAQDLDDVVEHDDDRTFAWAQTDDEAVVAAVLQALIARVPDLRHSAARR